MHACINYTKSIFFDFQVGFIYKKKNTYITLQVYIDKYHKFVTIDH